MFDAVVCLTGQRHFGLAVLALATVVALKTVASAKTANKFGTATNIETFDARCRCPAEHRAVIIISRTAIPGRTGWVGRLPLANKVLCPHVMPPMRCHQN